MISVNKILIFFLLILNQLFQTKQQKTTINIQSKQDLGLSVGSSAAADLITHFLQTSLKQPRQIQTIIRSAYEPWFDTIAHVDSKNRVLMPSM